MQRVKSSEPGTIINKGSIMSKLLYRWKEVGTKMLHFNWKPSTLFLRWKRKLSTFPYLTTRTNRKFLKLATNIHQLFIIKTLRNFEWRCLKRACQSSSVVFPDFAIKRLVYFGFKAHKFSFVLVEAIFDPLFCSFILWSNLGNSKTHESFLFHWLTDNELLFILGTTSTLLKSNLEGWEDNEVLSVWD